MLRHLGRHSVQGCHRAARGLEVEASHPRETPGLFAFSIIKPRGPPGEREHPKSLHALVHSDAFLSFSLSFAW